ncbi:MAG: transcriptional regulator [Candidatus Hodarchaeota archaeon]
MVKDGLILPSDRIFTTSVRLTIMILVYTHKKIKFADLQELLHLTPGNLDHHLKKLEEVNYLTIYKKLFPGRPLTVVEITDQGAKAFKDYIKDLRDLLNKIALK